MHHEHQEDPRIASWQLATIKTVGHSEHRKDMSVTLPATPSAPLAHPRSTHSRPTNPPTSPPDLRSLPLERWLIISRKKWTQRAV